MLISSVGHQATTAYRRQAQHAAAVTTTENRDVREGRMAAPLLSSLPLCFMLQEMTKRVLYCPNLMVSKLAVLVLPPPPQKPVHLPFAELVKVGQLRGSLSLRCLSC